MFIVHDLSIPSTGIQKEMNTSFVRLVLTFNPLYWDSSSYQASTSKAFLMLSIPSTGILDAKVLAQLYEDLLSIPSTGIQETFLINPCFAISDLSIPSTGIRVRGIIWLSTPCLLSIPSTGIHGAKRVDILLRRRLLSIPSTGIQKAEQATSSDERTMSFNPLYWDSKTFS